MPKLLPLQINALHLEKPKQVIGQDIRFENIPWMNTEKGVFENPNTPLETNSIIPRPFSYDNAIYLKEGVHLHFVLPTHFKKFDDHGNLPAAPNRWYIKNERSEEEWIVESDYIWNINDPDLDKHATCTYVEGEAGKDFNFHYVGRKYEFKFWKERQQNEEFKELKELKLKSETDSNKERLAELISKYGDYLKDITALGWGSMSFDVHYPNCRSVFGFHDEEGELGDIYTIIGWVDGDSSSPIVTGKFQLISNDKSSGDSVDFNIAIANTLPETLTALIVEDLKISENLTDRLKLEEQIESLLNFDALNDQKLDWVPRLRHSLHEKQFNRTEGFVEWSFELTDIPGLLEGEIHKIIAEISLKELNQKQFKLDTERQTFYSELENLYNQWSSYQNALFVNRTSSQELANDLIWIQSNVAKLNSTDYLLTQQKIEIDKLTTQLLYLLKSKINDNKDALIKIVNEYNKERADENKINVSISDIIDEIIITKKSTLDFYEPLAPSVIISLNNKNKIFSKKRSNKSTSKEINLVLTSVESSISIIKKYLKSKRVLCNSWNSYKVEWHANFLPKKNGYYLNQVSKQFKENFIEDTYILDEQNAELIKDYSLDGITYNASSDNYFGHSFIDCKIKDYILNKIKLFKENSFDLGNNNKDELNSEINDLLDKYEEKLKSTNLFSFTLSDFNHLMIQRSAELSVLPLIPNGFENHQAVAKDLHNLLSRNKGNINLLTTNRLATFNPLRNGAFTINRLRIVDSFGREKIIQPTKIISTKNQTFVDKDNWVILPPRILQESTLKLNFDYKVSNNEESPVIGWIVVSYLNQHLEFYDTNGSHLGAITSDGLWEPSPFDVVLASKNEAAYKYIGNDNLVAIIDWFLDLAKKDKDKFLSQVIHEIQNNLEHITPEDYQNPSLMETISSVPIAITKIDYQLLSKGKIVHDVNFAFAESTNDNGLSKIKFPVRFGDINQYNDGLIGYWHSLNLNNDQSLYMNGEEFIILLPESDNYTFKADSVPNGFENFNDVDDIMSPYLNLEEIIGGLSGESLSKKYNQDSNKDDISEKKELINDLSFLNQKINELSNNNNSTKGTSSIESAEEDTVYIAFIIKMIVEKGKVTKSDFLKHFIEKGNILWKTTMKYVRDNYPNNALKNVSEDNLNIKINGETRSIIALMHPKAKIFVKTGILPEQNIQIPYNAIKSALRNIELTLLTAPILTPKNDLQISLLRDKRYRWSWVELEKKTKGKALSFENRPTKNRITQDLAVKGLLGEDFNKLITAKNPKLIDKKYFYTEEAIHFIKEDAWQELINKEKPEPDELAIIDLVNQYKMSISDFNISNAQIPNLVLKEGWLSIKSTQL